MKQISFKLVKQKTKVNKYIGKKSENTKMNEEKIIKSNKEIKTIKRAIRNRQKNYKIYDDLS